MKLMQLGSRMLRTIGILLATALVVAIPTGCASTKKKDTGPKYVFFPPAPDEPRLQFLTSYNSDRDMRGGGRDTFMTYLTGKQPNFTPILKPYGGAVAPGKIYLCDSTAGLVLRLDLAAGKIHA